MLAGYYTPANKFVVVSDNIFSKTLQKHIAKFTQHDEILDRYAISIPFIAQLERLL